MFGFQYQFNPKVKPRKMPPLMARLRNDHVREFGLHGQRSSGGSLLVGEVAQHRSGQSCRFRKAAIQYRQAIKVGNRLGDFGKPNRLC
jgi:hypothetical protein